MPEWVDNKLTIKGPAESVERFIQRAQGHDPVYKQDRDRVQEGKFQAFSFHALYPVPLNVLEESYQQFGFDWELGHWGVKWGASESSLERLSPNEVVYTFDTPSGPPVLLLSNLAKEYDDLMFRLTYEGNEFTGLVKFRKGVVIKSRHRAKTEEPTTYDESRLPL